MKLEEPKVLRNQAYVNGQWIDSISGVTFAVSNPADGKVIGVVPDMGAKETQLAIEAAESAFKSWSGIPAKERTRFLRRWMELIRDNLEDLAILMTTEQGKPLSEARNEITMGGNILEWFSEEARRVYGDMVPTLAQDKRILVMRQAIGVVGAITPWNFPHNMIVRKCAPALAAGCTLVIKPAAATPLSALAVAELADRAEIPPGVVNVVTTSRPEGVGDELTTNPVVRKLSFTGSTEVGKLLMKQCSDTVKKVSLELGGNAPFILFEDADVEEAVKGAIASKFRNAGQTCVCANRFLVHDQVYDAFLERFVRETTKLVVGPGLDSESQVGPLINEQAIINVERLIKDAVEKGARVLVGGKRHSLGGNYFEPTVLAGVTDEMACTKEEIFGPVAPVQRFADEGEAIAIANNTHYGLASYFYSRDLGRVWRVAEAVDFGVVGVNVGNSASEVAPFGGVKESGIGREGGRYAMDEFVELKYVLLGGISS